MDKSLRHAAHERKVIHMIDRYLTCSVRWIVQRRAARVARTLAILLLLELCISLWANPAHAIDLLNVRSYAYKIIDNSKEFKCLDYIALKESKWNSLSDNPTSTAFGIFQMLGETSRDPYVQLQRALRYVDHRYSGSWCNAKSHHVATGWY